MALNVGLLNAAVAKAKTVASEEYVDTAIANNVPDLTGNNNTFAQQLGYESYAELVSDATASNTIINGGYLNTSLIDVDNLVAKNIAINGEDDNNGARLVINNSVIEVYDEDNVLRAKLGNLSA